jgi:hypothetical protein
VHWEKEGKDPVKEYWEESFLKISDYKADPSI